MTESPKLKQILKKKQFSDEDINFLVSLSKETLESLATKMSRSQVEKIFEVLSTPKVPSWINSTLKIHKSTPKLKTTLPVISKKKDFKKIVEMVMISAGDALNPNPETVKTLHNFIKSFIRKLSKMKKKTLYNKFPKVWAKYRPGIHSRLSKKEEESLSDLENCSDIDIKSIERLQFNDLRTSLMPESEYLRFSECRKALFTKFGKESFLAWSGADRNYKFLGWIAREKIFEIVEAANRNRSEDLKLTVLDRPLECTELHLTE
jgi:hypothetical protein